MPAEALAELIDPIEWWRNYWRSVVDRTKDQPPQAYKMMTEEGKATDWQLAYAWLYSGVVHADPFKRHIEPTVSITARYRAAAGVIARIGERVERTLAMVQLLDDQRLIHLDPSVYTVDVVVADPNLNWQLEAAYSSAMGAPLPTTCMRSCTTSIRMCGRQSQTSCRIALAPCSGNDRGREEVAQPSRWVSSNTSLNAARFALKSRYAARRSSSVE